MSFNNLPFTFTSGGYTKPPFGNVPFNWSSLTTANLQAAINVMGVYQDTTYTYLKECPKIVVGYTSHGVQILQLPCVYGGIRDLGASLFRLPPNVDLPAYIFALTNYKNLEAYLKPNIKEYLDISSYVYGIPPVDLLGYIHGFDTRDLGGSLHGWALKNLGSIIGGHLPANITAILNVIEIRNLPVNIEGVWWKGEKDLGAEFYKIWMRGSINLPSILHGWQEFDLPASIYRVFFKDLPALIQGSFLKNLPAYVYAIPAVELGAYLHGLDERFLPASLLGVYGPYDIQAYLNPIDPLNLNAQIIGWKGIKAPFNLKAYIGSWYSENLGAGINPVSPVDLSAYLIPAGQAGDLPASIIPKVMWLKKIVKVSLLEHLDLRALINFQCFTSTFNDLPGYLYTIYKHDLRGLITGWFGGTADNIRDVNCYINAGIINVQDRFDVRFVPEIRKYTLLKIRSTVFDKYKVFDDYLISFGPGKNLGASIIGVLTSYDLSATLNAIIQANYTELPSYVSPKTHEVVIDLNHKGYENWRRFVEIMFNRGGAEPYHYFYVSGENKVYKIDRSRHWTIWATSYIEDDETFIDRHSIRKKYIFKMDQYNNFDHAIRDLIDRVSIPRQKNLSAYIESGLGNVYDLHALIEIKHVYKWAKNLKSVIYTCQHSAVDLASSISPVI